MINGDTDTPLTDLPEEGVDMDLCIQNCQDCHSVCLATISYCLEEGGNYVQSDLMSVLMDCAEICQTSANFMLRGSTFHEYTCEICAEICEACAEACDQFSTDQQLQVCAEICRTCAASCEEMVEQMSQ